MTFRARERTTASCVILVKKFTLCAKVAAMSKLAGWQQYSMKDGDLSDFADSPNQTPSNTSIGKKEEKKRNKANI